MMDSDIFTEELFNLIKEGESYGRIDEILQESCLYNSSDASGKTVLHYSALHNNANLTQNLLNKGCNANAQDLMGNTPLMIATMQEHHKVIQNLILAGADIFKVNNENKSALNMVGELHMICCPTIKMFFQELQKKCSTNEEMVKELMDAGCHLYQAAILTDAKIIEGMLNQGCSVDLAHPRSKVTTLHLAVRLNDLDSVNVLLRYGANVNTLDRHNESPLFNMYINETDHSSEKVEILKVILDQGASMTTCGFRGKFQVGHILHKGDHNAIRVLLESGLDFNDKDDQSSETVLHYLARNSNPGLDEVLKSYVDKFDVNVVNKSKMTPLVFAVAKGNVDMVKFFLKQGARPNMKRPTLYYAYICPDSMEKYQQCIQLLLELYDADPQFIVINKQNQAETIFDIALKNHDLKMKRIKPVIDHLVIIEKHGALITETTKTVINSNVRLKKYFDQCREIIAEKISGRLVLFDLLISDERKMARYLDNDEIIQKLRDNGYFRHKIKRHSYYHNVLYRLYWKADRYRKLKNKAALVISELFQKRVNKAHLVIDNIIVHLNDQSLQQLSLLYNQLSHR